MKPLAVLGVFVLSMVMYLIFSGAIGPYINLYDIITGAIVSLAVAVFLADIVVENPRKIVNPVRALYLLIYGIYYLTIIEFKAHLGVMRLILSPGGIKPGIVRVPYTTESDYATVTVANSITNTPGTVVVDIDTRRRSFFVHWIRVETIKPEETPRYISRVFEKYAKKIFD